MDSDDKNRSIGGAIFSSDAENTGVATGIFSNELPQQQCNQIISPVPVSSGTGDIILQPSSGRRSKKGLVIGIILGLALVVGVVVAVLIGTGVISFGKTEEGKRNDFYGLLTEHRGGVNMLSVLTEGIYNGEFSVDGFMIAESEYSDKIASLEAAASDLQAIKNRLEEGPELNGEMDGIDLGVLYQDLKTSLNNDFGKYEMLVDVTKGFYEVFQSMGEIKAVDLLSEYDGVLELALYVDGFLEQRNEIVTEYVNNDCGDAVTNICNALKLSLEDLGKQANNTEVVQDGYYSMLGDFKYKGEGSFTKHLNDIYITLGDGHEK